MIAYLEGILQTKNTQQIVIDLHGIGYLVCEKETDEWHIWFSKEKGVLQRAGKMFHLFFGK